MVKISDGARIHRNRLQRMRRVQNPAMRALYEQGEVIRKDAADSIAANWTPSPNHVVSQPGAPPNADSGNLHKSIDVRVSKTRKSVTVNSTAPYAAALEFGTSKIEARPYLRPALLRNRNRIVYGVAQAVSELIRVYKSDSAFNSAADRYNGGA